MTTLAPLNLRDFPPVEVNIEPPETLRQSLLARHNVCPRSALFSQLYTTSSIPMDRGSAFHAFVERAVAMLQEKGEVKMPGTVASELADAVMAEEKDLVLPAAEQDAVRLMAHNWAESFLLNWDTFVGVEVPLKMQVSGWDLTCRLDLIEAEDRTIRITDWKTSLAIRKEDDVQRGFQGLFYALACLEGFTDSEDPLTDGKNFGAGINDVWFLEVYPRYRSEEGPLIAKQGAWNRIELAEFKGSLERNLAAFEESLETGDWPARDGSHCAQCAAPKLCPIPEQFRRLPEVQTREQAEAALSLKLAQKREGKWLQEALREWSGENGDVVVGDQIFSGSVNKAGATPFTIRKLTEEERNGREG